MGMPSIDIACFEKVVQERIRIPKGESLFKTGDVAETLFGIRVGSLKTQLESANGHVQVTGFLLPGEIAGLDGFLEGRQLSHAVALEDTEVCLARVDEIDRIAANTPALQLLLRRLTSTEIKRSHQLLVSLGVLRSEQRLAAFLVNMSQRLSTLGYSSTEFILRMRREEIGNYLGLTLETVSRLFSRFARENLIRIHQREVKLLDLAALRELAGTDCG